MSPSVNGSASTPANGHGKPAALADRDAHLTSADVIRLEHEYGAHK
jgi:hypothetical protein